MSRNRWVGDYMACGFNPDETHNHILRIYDHATHAGHILAPDRHHPTLPQVRLYDCTGCLAQYRLCLPGPSIADWDAPCSSVVPGICPSSFEGIAAMALGWDGGLFTWATVASLGDGLDVARAHFEEVRHRAFSRLEPSYMVGQASLLYVGHPQAVWRCDCCGRCIGRMDQPQEGGALLWLTGIVCSGVLSRVRGRK